MTVETDWQYCYHGTKTVIHRIMRERLQLNMTSLKPRDYKPVSWLAYFSQYIQSNMASSDVVTEVEIHPEIQEVEIEAIPVELPVETVETTVETVDGQPMIALQPLPEPGREEIILQTQEEIVGSADALAGYHQIPVPSAEDISIETSPGTSNKRAKRAKRTSRGKTVGGHLGADLSFETDRNTRKWEQKQVQIKTLEGEFSVTMWASGTDDGKWKFYNDYSGNSQQNSVFVVQINKYNLKSNRSSGSWFVVQFFSSVNCGIWRWLYN